MRASRLKIEVAHREHNRVGTLQENGIAWDFRRGIADISILVLNRDHCGIGCVNAQLVKRDLRVGCTAPRVLTVEIVGADVPNHNGEVSGDKIFPSEMNPPNTE